MEWIPVVFITFKLIVFAVGMFFAIKWHYDKGRKKKQEAEAAAAAAAAAAAQGAANPQ